MYPIALKKEHYDFYMTPPHTHTKYKDILQIEGIDFDEKKAMAYNNHNCLSHSVIPIFIH